MIKTVVGSFDSVADAANAARALRGAGFLKNDVNVVANNAQRAAADATTGLDTARNARVDDDASSGAATGAIAGGAIGGAAGLAVSLMGLAIPGVGAILAAGPIVAALTGAGAGAVAGSLIGALTDLEAVVTAGNTGALMATARFVLKTLPGIDRPAIVTTLPTMHDHVHVLDLGANVDCTPEQLLQFAIMGSILVAAVEGKSRPRVGLLNVGEEDIKGNETVKKTHELLRASPLNYAGFVEGDEIYTGDMDVIVCDGFVGNIMLKTIEGLARMITHFIKQEFKRNLLTKLSALVALPVLQAFRKRVDPRRYNGATLIGQ